MTNEQKPNTSINASGQSGGVNIVGGSGDINIGGDVVGRDKITTITTTTHHSTTINLQLLAEEVKKVNEKIDALPDKDDEDKAELKETVKKIEEEVKKGDAAKPEKVERWLKFIAGMSEDILDVAVKAFTNPALGIVEIVRKVAQKVKAGTSAAAG